MEAAPWYTPSQDESFDRKVIRVVATVIAAVLSTYLIYLLKTPLMWLVIASFIAIAVSGPVNILSKHMKRGAAIGIIYVSIVLIPVALGAILLPPLVSSAVDLVNDLPSYISDLEKTLQKDPRFEKLDENFGIQEQLSSAQKNLQSAIPSAAGALGDISKWIVDSLFGGFTIFVLSVFMVARGRIWIDAIVRRRAGPESVALDRTFDRVGASVSRYIGGAILQAFIAGVAAFSMLSVLGVSSPLLLAVVVAVFDVIPLVGSTVAGLFVGIVTLFASFPVDTIIWAGFVIAYQQFENYVVQPRIQSEAVNLEPFVVLTAVLFGGTLIGVVGAILAIPIAATLMIAFQEWGRFKAEVTEMQKTNGDDDQDSSSTPDADSPEPSPA
ncbi:MAG: AI-2E family transporter [Solirubrobacterales bacterium]|nr:AI-2E family transporter [Solirubrobacterales bacterium]